VNRLWRALLCKLDRHQWEAHPRGFHLVSILRSHKVGHRGAEGVIRPEAMRATVAAEPRAAPIRRTPRSVVDTSSNLADWLFDRDYRPHLRQCTFCRPS